MDIIRLLSYIPILFEICCAKYYIQRALLKPRQFYVLENHSIVPSTESTLEETHAHYDDCIRACAKQDPECRTVLVTRDVSNTVCKYYPEKISEVYKINDSSSFVLWYFKPQCSGYCNELSYLNLCGKCACHDVCYENTILPFYCDCTLVAETKRNCEEHRLAGFKKSGYFKIDPDGEGNFEVFCEMADDVNHLETCHEKTGWVQGDSLPMTTAATINECHSHCRQTDGVIALSFILEYTFCYCYTRITSINYGHTGWTYCEIVKNERKKSITGWIRMMTRFPSTDDYFWKKTAAEYKNGFGQRGNGFIGFTKLHRLTKAFSADIKVDFFDSGHTFKMSLYKEVVIGNEGSHFKIIYKVFDNLGMNDIVRFQNASAICEIEYWWPDCEVTALRPTDADLLFGFGFATSDYLHSITFNIRTFEKKPSHDKPGGADGGEPPKTTPGRH